VNRAFFMLALLAVVLAAALFAAPGDEPQTGETISARAMEKRGSFLTVLDFGAKGDGLADDSAAIQELIDSKAGSIRFPAGTYRIARPLVVNLDKSGFTSFVADGSGQLRELYFVSHGAEVIELRRRQE
jgi:polygalacturonase